MSLNIKSFNPFKLNRTTISEELKRHFSLEGFSHFLKTKPEVLNHSQRAIINKNKILSKIFGFSTSMLVFTFLISNPNSFNALLPFLLLPFFILSYKVDEFKMFTSNKEYRGFIQKYVSSSQDIQSFIQKEAGFFYAYLKTCINPNLNLSKIQSNVFMDDVSFLLNRWEKEGLTMSVMQDLTFIIFEYNLREKMLKFLNNKNRLDNEKLRDEFTRLYSEYVNSDIYKEPEQNIYDFFNSSNQFNYSQQTLSANSKKTDNQNK